MADQPQEEKKPLFGGITFSAKAPARKKIMTQEQDEKPPGDLIIGIDDEGKIQRYALTSCVYFFPHYILKVTQIIHIYILRI